MYVYVCMCDVYNMHVHVMCDVCMIVFVCMTVRVYVSLCVYVRMYIV